MFQLNGPLNLTDRKEQFLLDIWWFMKGWDKFCQNTSFVEWKHMEEERTLNICWINKVILGYMLKLSKVICVHASVIISWDCILFCCHWTMESKFTLILIAKYVFISSFTMLVMHIYNALIMIVIQLVGFISKHGSHWLAYSMPV